MHNGGLIAAAFIMLTSLDGSPIWVESNQVQIFRPSTKQCALVTGTGIRIGGYAVCVKETPEQVLRMLRDAK